jgi:hypothetical protein
MNRLRGHGRGNWVCSAKDFVDLGSRAAVDQALSRLAKAGKLRRVGRGLYDLPRANPLLKTASPAKTASVVNAVARRRGLKVAPDNIAAANRMGLTTAVPARAVYITDGPTRTIVVDGHTIKLRTASTYLRPWLDRPARPIVQALLWLGKDLASSPDTINTLRARLSKRLKRDLAHGKAHLPDWAVGVVNAVTKDEDGPIRKVSS